MSFKELKGNNVHLQPVKHQTASTFVFVVILRKFKS